MNAAPNAVVVAVRVLQDLDKAHRLMPVPGPSAYLDRPQHRVVVLTASTVFMLCSKSPPG